jgi:hypothetical protein
VGMEVALLFDMKPQQPPRPTKDQSPDDVAKKIHSHQAHSHLAAPAAGAVTGAAVGAIGGCFAGPPGAIAGAVVGGILGATSAYAMDKEDSRVSRHDAELDDEIGVTSPDLGAYPVKMPPEAPEK